MLATFLNYQCTHSCLFKHKSIFLVILCLLFIIAVIIIPNGIHVIIVIISISTIFFIMININVIIIMIIVVIITVIIMIIVGINVIINSSKGVWINQLQEAVVSLFLLLSKCLRTQIKKKKGVTLKASSRV